MKPPRRLLFCCLALSGVAGGVAVAARPPNAPDPIEAFQLHLKQVYLQTDADMFSEYQQVSSPGQTTTRERAIVQPAVGIGLDGSFYHPNLLYYRLVTELGVDWQRSREHEKSGSTTSFLHRYHVSLDLPRPKPYRLSVFADKDLTYRDYDFFSRVRVESTRYGARSGYTTGPVPFSLSYTHYDENVTETLRPTQMTQEMFNFSASNVRRHERANTQLFYNLNQYTHQDGTLSRDRGLSQTMSLSDHENFGSKDWIQLLSMLNYNSQSQTVQPNDKVFLHENLRLEHTPRLRSFYEYGFDSSTSGDAESSTQVGRVGVVHQLYRNLASSVDLHWQDSATRSSGTELDTRRYGVGLGESYTRHLSSWGNLSLGYSGSFDHEEHAASGAELQVINESHKLIDGTINLLSQPNVDLLNVRVTDATGTITYLDTLDYRVLPHGKFTEIQRVTSLSSAITNGATVLVTYSATQQPSAAYDSINNSMNFRIDLWDGRAGIYGRWTKIDYSGGEDLVLDPIDTKLVGLDASWRWLRTGLEYEVVKSRYAPYERLRVFQSLNYQPMLDATLSLDCDESWITQTDTGINQTYYSFIARYRQQLWMSLAWRIEGGFQMDRGGGYDRDVATARAGLDWEIGKIMFKLGYEYNNENYSNDLRTRHYFYIHVRRSFL